MVGGQHVQWDIVSGRKQKTHVVRDRQRLGRGRQAQVGTARGHAARYVLPPEDRHEWEWRPDRLQFRCRRCGRVVRRCPRRPTAASAPRRRCGASLRRPGRSGTGCTSVRCKGACTASWPSAPCAARTAPSVAGSSVSRALGLPLSALAPYGPRPAAGTLVAARQSLNGCGPCPARPRRLPRAARGPSAPAPPPCLPSPPGALCAGEGDGSLPPGASRAGGRAGPSAGPCLPCGTHPVPSPPGLPPEPGVSTSAASSPAGAADDWPLEDLLPWHGDGFDDP